MTTRPALLESIDPGLDIGGKRRPASDGATSVRVVSAMLHDPL